MAGAPLALFAGSSFPQQPQEIWQDDNRMKMKWRPSLKSSAIFLGVKGSVIALDRASGQQLAGVPTSALFGFALGGVDLWSTPLKAAIS
jgi:hypothetical protein